MKTFMFPTLAALLLAAALEGAFAADGPNLVVNGDFEAAGFTANSPAASARRFC